ncbi:MAG: hypothetical protein IPJ77_02290 [Planctomycetes bacterium]|nr:hypothetical protein [Planctomycetota bacterium]
MIATLLGTVLAYGPTRGAQEAARAPSTVELPREERVRRILQVWTERFSLGDFHRLRHWTSKNDVDPRRVDHHLRADDDDYGLGAHIAFRLDVAREFEAALFAAYGLDVQRDVRVDRDGVHARFDGVDSARKVAFELDGRRHPDEPETSRVYLPEPIEDALEPEEFQRLARDGWRVHALRSMQFSSSGPDDLAPYLALSLDAVEFLNDVTEGDDVDLRGLQFTERLRLPLPAFTELPWPDGSVPTYSGGPDVESAFELRAAAHVVLSIPKNALGVERGKRTERALDGPLLDGEWRYAPSATPIASAGSMQVLALPFLERRTTAPGGAPRLMPHARIVQARAAPLEPIVIEARGRLVLLPSAFDTAQPFEIELELQPGGQAYLGCIDVVHAGSTLTGGRR